VLRGAIASGRYGPGTHLVERTIGAELGVSSIAVREAFGRLADEGLVVRVPRRGTFVMSMTPEALKDLTRVRIVLEQLVVELAREHWTDEARDEVQAIVDQMRVAARRGDAEQFFQLDNRFHEAFWRLADSETLLGLAANLRGRIAHFLRRATFSLGRDGLDWSAGVHQDWLDGVANGDAANAKAEVERQILTAYERIARTMASEEPPAGSRHSSSAGPEAALAHGNGDLARSPAVD
jgi:DNA-binding GntR family transcriptional regulator